LSASKQTSRKREGKASRIRRRIGKLTRPQKKMLASLIFLIKFTALALPLYLIIWLNVSLLPMQVLVSDHVSFLLGLLGYDVVRDGLIITAGSENPFIFYIGEDCTGWKSMLCFLALVLATPHVRLRKRLAGLAAGLPVIYLGNLSRIVAVVFIQRSYGDAAARLFHDWLWQAGLISIVLLAWIAWLKWDGVRERVSGFLKKVF